MQDENQQSISNKRKEFTNSVKNETDKRLQGFWLQDKEHMSDETEMASYFARKCFAYKFG